MQNPSKRIKIFDEDDKSMTMESVYLTFDCGHNVHPNIFTNHIQGIVSIATNVNCKSCPNSLIESLNIGEHVIRNVLQVFSLTTFNSYLK